MGGQGLLDATDPTIWRIPEGLAVVGSGFSGAQRRRRSGEISGFAFLDSLRRVTPYGYHG